jgi:4-amino-4-deoxy-L-arabinose transferase-like glycosyltransferase
MGFKTFGLAIVCVLLIGLGIGVAGKLFLIGPLKVAGVCGAFFVAGMFFAWFIRSWRKPREAEVEETAEVPPLPSR